MTDREKLIALLDNFQYKYGNEMLVVNGSEILADYLIANGVTFADRLEEKQATCNCKTSDWISVEERLPDKDGQYLSFREDGQYRWIDLISFSKDARKVDKYDFSREWENVWYKYDSEYGHITLDCVTHWMPLPQPPKED